MGISCDEDGELLVRVFLLVGQHLHESLADEGYQEIEHDDTIKECGREEDHPAEQLGAGDIEVVNAIATIWASVQLELPKHQQIGTDGCLHVAGGFVVLTWLVLTRWISFKDGVCGVCKCQDCDDQNEQEDSHICSRLDQHSCKVSCLCMYSQEI